MAKVKLITEQISDVAINENKETNELFIEGIFSSAELKNRNGRVYKKDTLSREIEKLQEQISSKRLFGELNHPQSPEINLERAAILVEKLEWDGNDLKGRAKVLNTPMGKIARELIKEGSIGISSRGLGNVSEDGYVEDKSYRLITWDLVGNPSNHPSWVNGVLESKSFDVITSDDSNIVEIFTENDAKKEYKNYILEVLDEIKNKI